MNEIQIIQIIYLLQEINNNLLTIKQFIRHSMPGVSAPFLEQSQELQEEKDAVTKALVDINDEVIKNSMN